MSSFRDRLNQPNLKDRAATLSPNLVDILDSGSIGDSEFCNTSYSSVFSGNGEHTEKYVTRLRKFYKNNPKHDFIACVGNSGLGIGSILSYKFNIPLLHMRNSNAHRNSGPHVDAVREIYCNRHGIIPYCDTFNTLKDKSYVFVDDLIDTGKTFFRIYKALFLQGMVCTHILLSAKETYDARRIIKDFKLNIEMI